MPSMTIIIQEWGKNQTLRMKRAGQGMLVLAICFLHSDYPYQSSTGYRKPNYTPEDPVVLLDGCPHSPTWATQTLHLGYNN